jgi:hypothetical protein
VSSEGFGVFVETLYHLLASGHSQGNNYRKHTQYISGICRLGCLKKRDEAEHSVNECNRVGHEPELLVFSQSELAVE